VTNDNTERWRELCQEISAARNIERLYDLIQELNLLLELDEQKRPRQIYSTEQKIDSY